jgi:hypothetical protein
LVGKPEGKRTLGTPTLHKMIILKCFLKKQGGKVWTGYDQDMDQRRAVMNTVINTLCYIKLGFLERIVLLDFIHRLVSQEKTKLRN